MPAALRLSGIRKSYGRHAVLRGLDLDVADGETVAVLGANGSGKSTLLRIAATLSRADDGRVEVAGQDAHEDADAARMGLSVLTQDAPVFPELTPHEHLLWWSRMQNVRLDTNALEARTIDAGLGTVAHHRAGTLSRGQRQRLALALALLPERPLLILDEPFAALDADGTAWLSSRLQARSGATIMALHDEAEAKRLADRVLHLRHGVLA